MRQEGTESVAPALPVCGLRAVHPPIDELFGEERANSDNQTEDTTAHDDKNTNEAKYKYIHPLEGQPEWEIHRNKSATNDWQEHVVTWSYLDDIKADSKEGKALDDEGRGRATGDGSFVRNLLLGDVITVWGKSRFGGWVNNVENVKIEVYWAV